MPAPKVRNSLLEETPSLDYFDWLSIEDKRRGAMVLTKWRTVERDAHMMRRLDSTQLAALGQYSMLLFVGWGDTHIQRLIGPPPHVMSKLSRDEMRSHRRTMEVMTVLQLSVSQLYTASCMRTHAEPMANMPMRPIILIVDVRRPITIGTGIARISTSVVTPSATVA